MSVLRVIDANANRAREALRVMEDAARFVLDDAALSGDAKALRHALREALPANIQDARDSPGDVGTSLQTEAESRRAGVLDVVTAAGKRLGEALRTLEEFTKINSEDGGGAATLKQLRYRGYDLEQRLVRRLAAQRRGRQWRVCVLLTVETCALPWEDVLTQALQGGADCVQVREKEMGDAALLDHATRVVQHARAFAARHPDREAPSVVLNDRPDLAVLAGADGVHLGQHDLPADAARRILGRDRHVGVSTSSVDQARAAADQGADYCGVGPMFETTTKHKPELAGPAYLRAHTDAVALPHLAIGGVSPDNIAELIAAGAQGVAVSAAVLKSENPGKVVAALRAAWA